MESEQKDKCPKCKGTGKLRVFTADWHKKCPTCNGTGEKKDRPELRVAPMVTFNLDLSSHQEYLMKVQRDADHAHYLALFPGTEGAKRLMEILVNKGIVRKDATPTYSELLMAVSTALEQTAEAKREERERKHKRHKLCSICYHIGVADSADYLKNTYDQPTMADEMLRELH